jgi:GNAT superfamily N-acetyltransferase
VNPKAIVLARLTENELQDIGSFNCSYEGSLAAFCSVCCDAIPLNDDEREAEQITVHYRAPAIKIARLGRDEKYRGLGLGGVLIDYVKDMAYELSTSKVGVRFITADAYIQKVDYYSCLGFIPNQANRNKTSPTQSMRADIFD